jgi:hypothetical protein
MLLMSPAWRSIVAVSLSNVSRSSVMVLPYFRRNLLGAARFRPLLLALLERGGEHGEHFIELLAGNLRLRGGEELLGRAREERDAVLTVQTDDAGRDARQHGLHEAATVDQLLVGGDEGVALVLQFARHGVEGRRETPQVALPAPLGQLDCEIAPRDLLGGRD